MEIPQGGIVSQDSKVTRGSKELVLKAISVWINKPHVVNRRLCGSTIHHVRRCQTKTEAEEAVAESRNLFGEREENGASWDTGQSFKELSEESHPYTVICRELVPKSEFFPRLRETIVYEKETARVRFSPLNKDAKVQEAGNANILPTKELSYSISFNATDHEMPVWAQENEITLIWSSDHPEEEVPRQQVTSKWLRSVLLDKLVSWSQVNDISTSATSLMLVAVDKYKDTYVRLKNTYGRDLVKNWRERTDPKKFVYEDVAIAAYLLLIWEEDRERKGLKEKQSFVDLGCGNGLLVYILTKEGHKGLGIDLRKRNIWDTFGPDVDLREEAIKPSSEHLFPGYDWLIGNHSDELTPWIPVIAARSSPTCCFFVLPCCHHDFVGKFTDIKKGQSRYGTYVDYVKRIVEHCGFKSEVDTLRIPSTKRICLMGRQRTYKPEEETQADVRRQAFIDKRALIRQHKNLLPSTKNSSSSKGSLSLSSNTDSMKLRGQLLGLEEHANLPGSSEQFGVEMKESSMSTDASDHGESSDLMWRKTVAMATSEHFSRQGSLDSGYSSLSSLPEDSTDSLFAEDDMPKKFGGSLKRPESPGALRIPAKKKLKIETDIHMRTINRSDSKGPVEGGVNNWVPDFEPRTEPGVRNCQAVPEKTKLKIVNTVFDLVLKSDEEHRVAQLPEGRQWRKGGSASLSEVAALFDQFTLRDLKAECGGLQTLLRNHSHVFQVSGGRVMLRDFTQADPWKGCNPHKRQANKARAEQRDTRKTTLCWFYMHHPDSCPRANSDCSFAHGSGELREKPEKRQAVV